MIRQPSTPEQLLAWHSAWAAGQAPDVHDGIPECGWYKTKLVKGGPWTPVLIWCDREIDEETGELAGPEVLRADVFGREMDAAQLWTWLTPITREEYDHLHAWRLRNQHRFEDHRRVNLAAAPTLPGV